MVELTPEMEALWRALRPPEEPPANCQDCEHRHGGCAEFTALNRPNAPYNREWCHMYKKEQTYGDGTPIKTECWHFDHDLCGYQDPNHCNHLSVFSPHAKITCPRLKKKEVV